MFRPTMAIFKKVVKRERAVVVKLQLFSLMPKCIRLIKYTLETSKFGNSLHVFVSRYLYIQRHTNIYVNMMVQGSTVQHN